jgi:serine/threonine protein phosphatase PrpC
MLPLFSRSSIIGRLVPALKRSHSRVMKPPIYGLSKAKNKVNFDSCSFSIAKESIRMAVSDGVGKLENSGICSHILTEKITDPKTILKTNTLETISKRLPEDGAATLAFAEVSGNSVRIVTIGDSPAIVANSRTVFTQEQNTELKENNGSNYTEAIRYNFVPKPTISTLPFSPNMTIFLASDGVSDFFNTPTVWPKFNLYIEKNGPETFLRVLFELMETLSAAKDDSSGMMQQDVHRLLQELGISYTELNEKFPEDDKTLIIHHTKKEK